MAVTDRQWRKWTIKDWNKALFEHFFFDSDGEDRSVHRITVTGDELLKVIRDPDADAEQVQEAFTSVIRTFSHIEFNHRLRRYQTDPAVGWKGTGIPPFFAELAFSCLVASPPDGEIRGVGDFRDRLALLMDHKRAVAYYPLETLAPLWEAFGRWLDTQRAAGRAYRRLELPPRDYRVRIGYSINLAFPSRKDLENLIRILSVGGLTADPPIPTVLGLVGKSINSFSNGFRRVYEDFREAFRTRKTGLAQYPFWGAVREALDGVEDTGLPADEEGAALKLVMEPSGVVLLLSNAPTEVIKGELSFIKDDTLYGEFRNVLCVGWDFEQGILSAARRILRGRYQDLLTGKRWPLIRIAIDQGVLLFAKTEQLSWELVFTLQEERDCQALVKDSLVQALLSAFPENERPDPIKSLYQGWTQLENFSEKLLVSLRYDDRSPLAKIRCLQPTVRRPRISIVGGCPIEGGYLGVPECLPTVRAPFSTQVELVPVEQVRGAHPIRLTREAPDSEEFVFPGDLEFRLKGRFCFVGSRDDRALVRKEVVFRPDIIVNNYARPSDPNAWLVEAGGPAVITYDECVQACSNRSEAMENCDCAEGTPPSGSDIQSQSRTRVQDWRGFHSPIPTVFHGHGASDHFGPPSRLMEICGGLAMRRKGIPEREFLEFLQTTLKVDRYQSWDVVRAWVEAGYLDQLMSRKWRRTEYFPRIPQFVMHQDGSQVRAALSGLATSSLRNRVDVDLLRKGATRIETLSFSELVPPIPMWMAVDANVFEEVARSLALNRPTWVRPAVDTLWTLSQVVSCKEDPPRFHDCWGCWDWEKGWFVREAKPTGQGIEIARFVHVERPPFYEVLLAGEHAWWSTSRNWALLLAHDLLGVPCFALSGSVQVSRSTSAQVYLPLPIGRYLSLTCPVCPGLVSNSSGAYCYQFQDSSERSRILEAIWGGAEISIKELRRWGQWLLGLSRRKSTGFGNHSIPLPAPIRQELERFPDVPEFQELSRIRLDPSLILRLRDGLSRLVKDRGD